VGSPLSRVFAALAALTLGCTPHLALAQSQPSGGARATSGSDMAGPAEGGDKAKDGGKHHGGRRGAYIDPYVGIQQVVNAELSPGSSTQTYTQISVGVDATVAGRNNAGSLSLQYDRQIGWGRTPDADTITGIARGYASIIPDALRIDVGGLAARTHAEGFGSVPSQLEFDGAVSKIYGVYAGPSLSTNLDDVKVDASYRFGYTKVDQGNGFVPVAGAALGDIFDESTVHNAELHLGTRPHTVLPVGLGAGVGYYREDISNLDQRVEDLHARADILVPISLDLALVGGIGYEKVQISSRDALIGPGGLPVIEDGRFVTDQSAPRRMAYDVEGLIWDAGVIWRPSRRTELEAHVGRRYGTTSYFGSFAYAPNDRSSLNIAVYDNVAGFGGQLNRALADLPTEFTANRNPLSGDLAGCVAAQENNGCITGALGSLRSATFRARGVMASWNLNLGRTSAGIGAGYDRRKFIAAPGTVLALANGVIDENWWVSAYFKGRIDERSGYGLNAYANWFHSGSGFDGDLNAIGATASYYRRLANRLTGHAAIGIEGINRDEPFDDFWVASAMAGLRYSF